MIKILVVDDNHTPREVICEALKQFNIQVKEAVNGVEATKILEAEQFNLVITDVVMPEMNGYELCRWIKTNPATGKIPVIICSTKGEDFDIHWATKQGADAYIIKPFKTMELLKTIKYLLKHNV
ncbi:MAG: response regulator [Cyanobacteria bacterium]|nr:response regulator [Cyanobacteria bacterium CG_2015-16_32_12]NCO76737.1 response regulator [Cyanobacteria bacterium CG_2015-22_32_23]NCQ04383.1 response regulator [Cyanobacteria bacterium CG_2015-09_32_10]NCQ42995.1 response regulator [Cyanobacteria bacterium CG_2015-04_32_10]NCS84402.1 response regulator [Cyanobacteria bacterium CG_2015-02_32_10]